MGHLLDWNCCRETRDNLWDETQTMRFEDYEEGQSLFLQLVLAWFFLEGTRYWQQRETHINWTWWNRR